MLTRWLLATLHLTALGVGLGAVWARGRALRGSLDADGLRRVFYADALWGVAAVVWIVTGLLRAFGGWEKGTAYYLQNHVFLTKMALLAIVLALEVWPMATLIRWRIRLAKGEAVDTSRAPTLARICTAQAWLVVAMVFAATAMARGLGTRLSALGPRPGAEARCEETSLPTPPSAPAHRPLSRAPGRAPGRGRSPCAMNHSPTRQGSST